MDILSYKSFLSEREIPFKENEETAAHTTFRIGGPALLWVMPAKEKDLTDAVDGAIECGVRYTVLGRGSNVVFDDGGFCGAVISTEGLNKMTVSGNILRCQCGASFTGAAVLAKDSELSGLEFAYGIPGAVGGAVYMNAGAYGSSVDAVLEESTYYDTVKKEIVTLAADEHEYAYRKSVYMKHRDRVILSASFKLVRGDKDKIKESMTSFMNSRREKQPLEYPSAGSVFKRAAGHYTGQMIEELGLKGYTVGGACVSEKHAGFIINAGGATSSDVEELVRVIKDKVKEAYGVELETELIFIK